MRLGSRRARRALGHGQPLADVLLLEAVDQGWMTVLGGSVVEVLHAAAKLQEAGLTLELDDAPPEPEFALDDELPTPTLTVEIPTATPRGGARYADALLGRRVCTYGDAVDLCHALGLLTRETDGTWRVCTPLPMPADVLPLDDDERPFHDHRQWRAQLGPTTRAVVAAFRAVAADPRVPLPFDRGPDALGCTASLYWWCQRVDAHPETVRRAVLGLIAEHDFSAFPAPDRLYWDEPFALGMPLTVGLADPEPGGADVLDV